MRQIETKTARSKLPPGKARVFVRLGEGVSIGYRRNANRAGVWIVRLADGQRGKIEKRIALADDLAAADGRKIMDYQQAAAAARRLGNGESADETPAVLNVDDAIKVYEADLIARNGQKNNATRLRPHITPAMLKRPVALLDVTELRKWRDGLTGKMVAASVNRLITCFKAALNLAAAKDESLNSRAWEIGLAALPEATEANNVVLAEGIIRQLVCAAHEQSSQFGVLVETLAVTGARISQLARCQARDLVADRLMIPSSAKGQKKRATRTPVPIPTMLAERLRAAATGRKVADVLFTKPSGESWKKSDHSRPFERCVVAVGEDPKFVSIYALRHSHITAQLLAGLPVQLVAKLHDTSASQIEKHYAAAITSHTDELVRKTMVAMGPALPGDNVVPIRN